MKKLWIWGVGGALAAVAALALAYWARTPGIVRRLPPGDVLAYLNLRPLRRAGWLGRAEPQKNPEYATFVRESGFDFERDLDEVALTQRGWLGAAQDTTCILQGRFGEQFFHYLATHALSQSQMAGITAYRFAGWARPQQTLIVARVAPDMVIVTNRSDAATALAAAQRRWTPGPELWRRRRWWGARVGYAAMDVMQLAARRQLDGSQEPWRGGQRLEAGIRATAQGVEIAGDEVMDNPGDAAAAAAWLVQQAPLPGLRVSAAGADLQFNFLWPWDRIRPD